MGYTGSAAGLLDADTNLSYAVPYLANAYRVAGGNETRAVSLYASGFYGLATPTSMLAQVPAQPGLGGWLASVFSPLATEPQQAASEQVKGPLEDDAPVGRKRRSKWSHIAAAASPR